MDKGSPGGREYVYLWVKISMLPVVLYLLCLYLVIASKVNF